MSPVIITLLVLVGIGLLLAIWLMAMCGRLRVGKGFLTSAALVGAAMCSAFECGSHDRWP